MLHAIFSFLVLFSCLLLLCTTRLPLKAAVCHSVFRPRTFRTRSWMTQLPRISSRVCRRWISRLPVADKLLTIPFDSNTDDPFVGIAPPQTTFSIGCGLDQALGV